MIRASDVMWGNSDVMGALDVMWWTSDVIGGFWCEFNFIKAVVCIISGSGFPLINNNSIFLHFRLRCLQFVHTFKECHD